MKMQRNARFLIVAAAIGVMSTVLYAAFTFNAATSSQPTTTLAPYALSSTDLSGNHVYAYGPWFENGAWQGDLIEYTICGSNVELGCPAGSAGTRSTDANVGSNPPTAPGSNWMARATFAAKEGADPIATAYWQEKIGGRHIFTVSNGSQVDFLWNNLSDEQKLSLDSDTADPNNNFSQGLAPAVAGGAAYDSPILNFIRGDRSNEKSQPGGIYRIRYNLLGDIINSNPVYIGAPTEAYNIAGFPAFKAAITDPDTGRDDRIAVGANDGMLHVFDTADGSEVYAYIPSMLILDPDATLDAKGYPVVGGNNLASSKLRRLAQVPYKHTYFVDGQLTAASAQINGNWKTVLAGGTGGGSKGVFALDVTKATAADVSVLFEKTGADIGHIYGQPTIARLKDEKWYLITGNGFGSTSDNARLLIISLDPPYTMTSIPACAAANCIAGEAHGLAAPALVDTNGDYKVDYAYAGDDNGDMWRFNLADNTATKIFDGDPDQPITSAPELGFQPNGGYMVYFGTGTIQHTLSPSGDYPTQAIYGIWDRGPGAVIVDQTLSANTPVFDNTNQQIAGVDCTPPPADPPPDPIRYMDTINPVDFLCDANDASCAKGWRVLLNKPGEQVLGSIKLRAGRLTVVTNAPGENLKGDSWLISLDYLTGGDGNQIVFNTNRDNSLDDCDKYTGDKLPVGLGFGDGNISQPVLGRIGPGQDIMFINGLRLPVISSKSLLGGHLDVETDSRFGGTTAPNTVSKHSEGYNVKVNDGPGFGVDGHFHQYDEANHVTYVDLFQLEPQRGKANFVIKTVALENGSCPAGSVSAGAGCIEAVEPELNRAYDTLTDPLVDPSMPKSEVFGKDPGDPGDPGYPGDPPPLLADDQPFIVVLANADLSSGGTLQIGCREWAVKDYQDMLTEQLEANVSPGNLVDYATYEDKINNKPRTAAGSLVFTLKGIASEKGGICTDENPATVRVTFTYRSIIDAGVVGTRAQCVLGLHDYRDKVCYSDSQVLGNAPSTSDDFPALYDPADPTTAYNTFSYASCNDARFASQDDRSTKPTLAPPTGYIRNPNRNLHITESSEGEGGKYRWRNGALTVQFIATGSFAAGYNCSAANYNDACPLQDPKTLPRASAGKKQRFAGTYAKAFKIDKVGGKDVVTSLDTSNSGLLYESTIFWHYSDLADILRRADPASIPCYGDANYNGALVQELGGLTLGEYNKLIDGLGDLTDPDSLISQYAALLETLQAAINNGNEALINKALLELGQLLEDNPQLAEYEKFRDYAPGHIPENKLLGPDKDQTVDEGEPAQDVEQKPLLDRDTLGPNLTAGRRSWIDLSD